MVVECLIGKYKNFKIYKNNNVDMSNVKYCNQYRRKQ